MVRPIDARRGFTSKKQTVNKNAVVGLDIGPSTIAIVGHEHVSLRKFCGTIEQPWRLTRTLQRKMDRSRRVTNPHCFNENGTWKKGQKFTLSKRYLKTRTTLSEVERKLTAERKRFHGELANEILKLGNIVQSEILSYLSFQKNDGKRVKVRAPGMFVEQLRRKAESADGQFVDLHTGSLKMSQYDHVTQIYTKKPLSQRWHVLGDGSGVVQRDIYSAFLARCVIDKTHHLSHLETMWASQKPVLEQMGWLRDKPAKIELSGKIAVAIPSERVVCRKGLVIGHDQDVVVIDESLKTSINLSLKPPRFSMGWFSNICKTIIREQLTDLWFYDQMPQLLDDLIQQSRADAAAYEAFLRKAEAQVKRLAAKQPDKNVPAALHGKREAAVIYNNFPRILAAGKAGSGVAELRPGDTDKFVALALEIDRTMCEQAPAAWKGDQSREAQVLNALFRLLDRNRKATQALFDLVKHQPGYDS